MGELSKARVIAFYLPQFYPTAENDEWWRPGFTEWHNVVQAKPLFKGHHQPHLPANLGFYDLRLAETREAQAELAREAGIEGFCYWHYWLGGGRRLLDRVFREVVESGKPDFPFCLCWANHSWYAKAWDPNIPDKLLAEQTFPGKQDYIDHFYAILPAFKDKRYIRVNGKLLFGIFQPFQKFDFAEFASIWNELAGKEGLNGFHFFAYSHGTEYFVKTYQQLYDAAVFDPIFGCFDGDYLPLKESKMNEWRMRHNIASPLDYQIYAERAIEFFKRFPFCYPCLNPNYDHSPRSKYKARILHDSTPDKWENLYRKTLELFSYRPQEENLVFIKAWNEWGEGNYLEPDMEYGKQYIERMAKVNKELYG